MAYTDSKIHLIVSRLWRLLIIAVAMTAAMPCRAQNNPLKISDQLYPMYDRAFRARTTPEGRDLALHMYRKAVAVGDKRAQVAVSYTHLTLPTILLV